MTAESLAVYQLLVFAEALDEYLMDDEAKAKFTPLDEWRDVMDAFAPLFDRETVQ